MNYVWWSLTLALMAAGLVGTLTPVIPGTTIILAAAVLHRLLLGAAHSASWLTVAGIALLALVSYAVELMSGTWGARRFGATKWGAIGGLLGGLVGLFFGLIGVFIGPLLGVLIGELLGGKDLLPATRTTWGSFLGSTAGMLGKFILGVAMIGWFLLSAIHR